MLSASARHTNITTICSWRKITAETRYTLTLKNSKRLLSNLPTPADQVIFSGIQPTGVPHIGNYLGALKQWAGLQNRSLPTTELFFSVVDLHAITVNQDAQKLRRWKLETLAALLAVGLDPDRSTMFYQSSV